MVATATVPYPQEVRQAILSVSNAAAHTATIARLNFLLGELVNGWQLSNYTTYEDGAPYQTVSPNMNLNYQQFHDASNKEIDTNITMPIPSTATEKSVSVLGLPVTSTRG